MPQRAEHGFAFWSLLVAPGCRELTEKRHKIMQCVWVQSTGRMYGFVDQYWDGERLATTPDMQNSDSSVYETVDETTNIEYLQDELIAKIMEEFEGVTRPRPFWHFGVWSRERGRRGTTSKNAPSRRMDQSRL